MQSDRTHHDTTVASDLQGARHSVTVIPGLRLAARTVDATGTTTDRRDARARPETSGRTVEAPADGGTGE